MRIRRQLLPQALATLALAACEPDSLPGPGPAAAYQELGLALDHTPAGQALPFIPIPASAACQAGGSVEQLILPQGYLPSLIATEGPGFPDLADMLTVNETGRESGRYLYRTHETGSNGAVSVTDLASGETTVLAQQAHWERLDGIVWTPWGTILTAEETGASALQDPALPAAVNSLAEAAAKGATGYARPEDVEIGTSTGSDRRGEQVLYVAITGENRVLALDLKPRERHRVYVSDYVRNGVNAPVDFTAPDNLALDRAGNLYITEDPGGTAASGKTLGDDVWFAPFNPASAHQALPAARFLTITDCDAEPTGIYLSPSGKTLYLNVQHRGGADPRDQTWGVRKFAKTEFLKAAE
jgi:hypothetical protein